MDAFNAAQVDALIAETIQQLGGLDILFQWPQAWRRSLDRIADERRLVCERELDPDISACEASICLIKLLAGEWGGRKTLRCP